MYKDYYEWKTEEAEAIGRNKLTSYLQQMGFDKIEECKGLLNQTDMYAEKKGKKYVFEIKVRNRKFSDWIIEPNKMETLQIRKYDYDLDGAFYVTFYDDYMYLYDVENTPYSSSTIYADNTTIGIGWKHKHKVNKYVHHYGFNNAWIYKYQNNSWDMISIPDFKKEEHNETANTKEKTNQKG